MKIHIDNVNVRAPTGPNTFGKRLAAALFEMGHEVVFDTGTRSDVSLVFIERSGRPLADCVIQRLDGFWHDTKLDYDIRNTPIRSLYDIADGIIYQTKFDHRFITKYWGDPQQYSIIHNGIDTTKQIHEFTNDNLLKIRQQYNNVYVCSAQWRQSKRLNDTIKLFKKLREFNSGTSCLLVMGMHPDCSVSDVDIFYGGHVAEDLLLEIHAMSNWMIHLAYLDHCPNAVIEALSQQTPVICTSSGGTHELVGDFGYIINEEFDYSLVDTKNPPSIDIDQIKLPLPDKSTLGAHANIDIKHSARQYIDFCVKVLSNKRS